MRILSLLDSPLKEGSVWVTITVQDVENGKEVQDDISFPPSGLEYLIEDKCIKIL